MKFLNRIFSPVLFLLTAIAVAWNAYSQPLYMAPNPGGSEHRGDTVVALVTCYPGAEIYQLEGHTALRINGPDFDWAVHYGVFDFNSPNFLYRFVKGETDYMAVAIPWEYFLFEYLDEGRRVEEQSLSLTPAETRRLVEYVKTNLLPENRVYRYNYVKDNCATRPLDAIEHALGYRLSWDMDWPYEEAQPATFRDVMRYYHRNYPWYQFGIDLALGSGIDYPLQAREYAFAPVVLHDRIASALRGDGTPLVGATRVDNDLDPMAAVDAPTPWWLSPTAVCWLVFAILLLFTVRDIRRGRVTRWIDAVYFGIMGVAGLLLTFLIFVSVHEATSPNWLFAWLNPFCLIVPVFIWLKRCKIVVISYEIVNFAIVIALLAGWYWLPQSANVAFLPLVLGDIMRSGSYIYLNNNKFGKSNK